MASGPGATTATLGAADKDGKRALTVSLKIDRPWHIYANPVDNDDLEGARTTVDVYADGKKMTALIMPNKAAAKPKPKPAAAAKPVAGTAAQPST